MTTGRINQATIVGAAPSQKKKEPRQASIKLNSPYECVIQDCNDAVTYSKHSPVKAEYGTGKSFLVRPSYVL